MWHRAENAASRLQTKVKVKLQCALCSPQASSDEDSIFKLSSPIEGRNGKHLKSCQMAAGCESWRQTCPWLKI
jgi:hypothetical protein